MLQMGPAEPPALRLWLHGGHLQDVVMRRARGVLYFGQWRWRGKQKANCCAGFYASPCLALLCFTIGIFHFLKHDNQCCYGPNRVTLSPCCPIANQLCLYAVQEGLRAPSPCTVLHQSASFLSAGALVGVGPFLLS